MFFVIFARPASGNGAIILEANLSSAIAYHHFLARLLPRLHLHEFE
jgi:hypothetical protein